ncbi:MAG: hypothetical protein ACJ76N_29510 [Thermoanaerobaculia bacterium]
MLSRALASLGAALLFLAGCGGGESPTEPQGPPRRLPTRFQLLGAASAVEPDGTSISCDFELVFELKGNPRESPGVLEYDGAGGGGLRRTILDATGRGISLQPDAYGAVVVRSLAPDRIEITTPLNADAKERFWRELSRFEGTFDSPRNVATGTWSCAPFDINSGGYTDTKYTVRGSWSLVPVP